jgi:hypothetical protein
VSEGKWKEAGDRLGKRWNTGPSVFITKGQLREILRPFAFLTRESVREILSPRRLRSRTTGKTSHHPPTTPASLQVDEPEEKELH